MPEMTPEMAGAAVGFLVEAWPVQKESGPDRQGWDHMFSTSYQIACMALVALGEADETVWGAVPKSEPRLPLRLPLWEDIAVAVLWLAHQQNLIGYHLMDGTLPASPRVSGFVVTRIGAIPLPAPNIAAGPGSGPALAAPSVVTALEALGLVDGARWTPVAEVVHWRGSGGAFGLGFEGDARFPAAVNEALATLPAERREAIDRLMRITVADVAAGVAQSVAGHEEARAKWGPEAQIGAPLSAVQVRGGLPRLRENALDWIFYRRWRLERGWLDDVQAARALEIFHDRLAIAMRQAVVARLYPGGFIWD